MLTTPAAPTPPIPTRLIHLDGIGHKLADRITRHYNELRREFKRYGAHDHLFAKLASQPDIFHGDEDTLSENEILTLISFDPYALREVRGINFKRADTIALNNFHVPLDHPMRHAAGNQSIIEQFGPLREYELDKQRDRSGLHNRTHARAGVILDHDRAWIESELNAEQDLAHLFEDVLTSATQHAPADLTNLNLGNLNDDQLKAVATALSGVRTMALTGFAGTGKSRTTAAIAHAAKARRKTMRVMAFAGKAAMRSAEAMLEDGVDWIECSTIHRALQLRSPNTIPAALEEDIIVLDEASMIPNWLMAKVVQAMHPSSTLVLVGDPNQLPPIGYGTPFQDYLKLGLPHVHLEINYRQAGQVNLQRFAEAIRAQAPDTYQHQEPESGVHLRFNIDPVTAEAEFNQLIRDAATRLPHFEWQLVTWKNDTKDALNQLVQELLNPNGIPLFTYRLWSQKDARGNFADAGVAVGDKVIVTDNDYDYGVFNGQTGKVTARDGDDLIIDFGPGEGEKAIPIDDARDLIQLGYAVTVHKAQGSGWDTVILYQPEPVKFNPRRFYYTSVTRAKNHVHLITTLTRRDFWVNALQPDQTTDSTLIQRVHEAR